MSKKLVCLHVVGLILVPLAMWAADPASPAAPALSGCSGKLINLTDSDLALKLTNMTLVPAGPVMLSYRSTGAKTTTKVSRGQFIAYDQQGNALSISVSCSMTCSGSACLQSGCEVSGNGCSSWDCGTGCTGSCTQNSQLED